MLLCEVNKFIYNDIKADIQKQQLKNSKEVEEYIEYNYNHLDYHYMIYYGVYKFDWRDKLTTTEIFNMTKYIMENDNAKYGKYKNYDDFVDILNKYAYYCAYSIFLDDYFYEGDFESENYDSDE